MNPKISKRLSLFLAVLLPAGAFAVTLEENGGNFVVSNKFYTAKLEKAQGFRPKFTIMNGKKVHNGTTNVTILMDMQNEKYNGGFIPSDAPVQRNVINITPKVLSKASDKVVLEFTYKFNAGNAVETVTFDDSMAIGYDLKINKTNRLAAVEAYARLCGRTNDVVFYPDNAIHPGFQNAYGGKTKNGPVWSYGYYKNDNAGTGFILPKSDYSSAIRYQMQDAKGWSWNSCNLTLAFDPLRQTGKTGTIALKWYLLAGGTPAEAQKTAETILGKKRGIELYDHEIQRISVRPGESNVINAELRNHSDKEETFTLRSTLFYGLNNEQKIFEKQYTFPAGKIEKIKIPVTYPAGLLKGTAVRTQVLDASGKEIAKHTVFCAVTDFVPRDAPVGVMNMQMANQPTSEIAWVNEFKQKYVASYEYYAWAYTTIFGLAPEQNEWVNNSDSFYDVKVTKDYVKSLVKTGKENGVDTFAWITGLWHYKVAFRTPERIQYTADGQPNVYHGRVMSNGKRRQMVVKPNAYDPEFAKQWGEEMARSIDMFGWAGCRWDWSFVPTAVNDPLYNAGKAVAWFNHEGIPSTKLFPDPDQIAYDCTVAWRKAVNDKYPDFIFGINASGNKENWNRYPKHQKEISRRAMTLFEDMLSFYRPQIATFEKWGRELAERAELYRPQDAAPTVGWMHGLPPSSVSTNLAMYTAYSAGVKWVHWPHRRFQENSEIRNAFVMRYADYYFGTDFLRPKKLSVAQNGKDNVLWEPFVRERKTDDGREIVIPIVNMPDGEKYICQFHEPPAARNASFKISLKPGETAEAWVMTPQAPEKAQKLKMEGNTVTVPGIVDAAMVLIKCKGGK